MTCIICNHRPAVAGAYCHNCNAKIQAVRKRLKSEKPVKFATYRGHVVGFFRNGGKKLVPRLLHRKPDNLPKRDTLDLNTYIPGFTREQVKKIKAVILQLANS